MSTWKPVGYSSVSPYLIVTDARATIEFLEAAFDAKRLRCIERADGKFVHAEARIDDTVIMLSDPADGRPAIPSHVHVYVPDVDTSCQGALDAGAKSVSAPARKDDEDKRSGVKDPGGTTWWIASQV